jgi:NAD(P)-dependent dehydrogenase (short-subunit alcohol dehydrogenase family)
MGIRTVLITGANGSIGQGLCKGFQEAGWRVIGSDNSERSKFNIDNYISLDLDRMSKDSKYRENCIIHIKHNCVDGLAALINNAATQILAPVRTLSFENWQTTININLNSPFILIQELLLKLIEAQGSVVNIASIHSTLTKPNFSAYATSKAGLVGLTKSLAVELGGHIRVNAICPAAIDTPMLHAGFVDNSHGLEELKKFHPTGKIGSISDVVNAALYMPDNHNSFLNGSILSLDGGISSRLHDPE